MTTISQPSDQNTGPGEEARPDAQPIRKDKRTPGHQERPLTPEEDLDNAVEETFPASDPISPSRIDGPNT